MKKYFLLALTAVLTLSSACKKTQNSTEEKVEKLEMSAIYNKESSVKMYEVPARLKDRPEQILHREGFTISYNATTKTPNWVAWHLTKSHTYGKIRREERAFEEDMSVAAPRATPSDYYNSRYDRGHMCPAGDNKWSEDAMAQSFFADEHLSAEPRHEQKCVERP